ncbi:MAG: hypothetical protein ACHP65_06080 [Legionellales bacterium]
MLIELDKLPVHNVFLRKQIIAEANHEYIEQKKAEIISSMKLPAQATISSGGISYIMSTEECQSVLTQLQETLIATEQKMRVWQKQAIVEYMEAPHNNGKKLQHVLMSLVTENAKEKISLSDFSEQVQTEINRLRDNAKSTFSVGNNNKADKIAAALLAYQADPSGDNRAKVQDALAIKRFFGGLFTKPTQATKNVSSADLNVDLSAAKPETTLSQQAMTRGAGMAVDMKSTLKTMKPAKGAPVSDITPGNP